MYAQTGATANPYLYTGQRYDTATGQYYLRARYYDPAVGRFLTRDSYPLNQYDPREWNRYTYAAGNPVTYADPSGYGLLEYAIKVSVIGGATIGFAVGAGTDFAFQLIFSDGSIVDNLKKGGWKSVLASGFLGAISGGVGGWMGAAGKRAFIALAADALADMGLGTLVDIIFFEKDPLPALALNAVGFGLATGLGYAFGRVIGSLRPGSGKARALPDDLPASRPAPRPDNAPRVRSVGDEPDAGRSLRSRRAWHGDDPNADRSLRNNRTRYAGDDLVPGTPEHKAARWQEYQTNPDNADWGFQRWSNNYEQNMVRARNAQAQVEAYAKNLDWGTTQQVTLPTALGGRRFDIVDVVDRHGLEFKSGNYFYRDPDIMLELAKDASLVQQGWQVEWVFEVAEGVSDPLIRDLKRADIIVIVNGVVR